MGWGLGEDTDWNRFVGYTVPAYCDHPGCMAEINRGLSYVCGNAPYGGETGCGLYFCSDHLYHPGQHCERCEPQPEDADPFEPTGEHPEWIAHISTDEEWEDWRNDHPEDFQATLAKAA